MFLLQRAAVLLALLFVCAGGASAQNWNDLDARPNNLEGGRAAFYIWREGDTVYIAHNRAKNRRISGDVTVSEGTMKNPRGFSEQTDRRFSVRSPQRLIFNYTANDPIDGIKFNWDGTGTLTIRTGIDRGNPGVYVGRSREASDGDTIRIRRGNGDGGDRFPGGGRDEDYNDDYGKPAEGTWNDIADRPENIERATGIYVWREGEAVHIVCVRRNDAGGRVSGDVRVENSVIRNPRGFHDERDNRFTRKDGSRIHFNINRSQSVDGVKFDVKSGARIFIRVRDSGGREQRYFLGANKRRVVDNALLIK